MKTLNSVPSSLETKRASTPLANVDGDGTFSGYASLFGKVDLAKDRVASGAFQHSLMERGTKNVRMLFQHDPAQPIGVWKEIREDDQGLFVKGKIATDTRAGRDVLALLRSGAVDGLSIGFRTKKSRTNAKSGIRTIEAADLWEISIVTFPMLPQARITQIKAASRGVTRSLPTTRTFERWLTQDAGLTRREARTVIKSGFAQLTGKQDAAVTSDTRLLKSLRQATRILKSRRHND